MSSVYDQQFYDNQRAGSLLSASIVLPHLESIYPEIRSVVDVGCGGGTWLSYFGNKGVRILGIDGNVLPPEDMMIPTEAYRRQNLEDRISAPATFDLCMCLEVAEHLPANRAATFVEDLCQLGNLVLFGAGIPGQGGTNHINCQWQSYWIEMFRQQGFGIYDLIRPTLWNDSRIEWWYLQNTMVFVRSARADLTSAAERYSSGRDHVLVDVVHPRALEEYHYVNHLASSEPSARVALGLARKAVLMSARRRLKASFGKS